VQYMLVYLAHKVSILGCRVDNGVLCLNASISHSKRFSLGRRGLSCWINVC
jgi:hypothetical protein